MRTPPLVPLLVGIALIVGAFVIIDIRRENHEADVRGVERLSAMLDSTRLALAAAGSGPDSARLAAEVKEREYYFGRRAYHLGRQESIDAWWTVRGPGSWLVGIGALCLVIAAVTARRSGRASARQHSDQDV